MLSRGFLPIILTLLLGHYGCISRKKKDTPSLKTAHLETDTLKERCRMDFKSGKSLSERMNANSFLFNYASAKLSCELTMDGEEYSFTINVRILKDSVIWMSISKLGIDAARVMITKDSVKFTVGMGERKFFKGDFSYINSQLKSDLDFDMLQALLFGNSAAFYDDDEKLRPGRDQTDCRYFLSTVRKKHAKRLRKGMELPKESYQTIWLDPNTFKITEILFEDPESKRKFNANYDRFASVGNFTVPMRATFKVLAEKNLTARIDYGKITVNDALGFPFSIPTSYKRIYFQEQVNVKDSVR